MFTYIDHKTSRVAPSYHSFAGLARSPRRITKITGSVGAELSGGILSTITITNSTLSFSEGTRLVRDLNDLILDICYRAVRNSLHRQSIEGRPLVGIGRLPLVLMVRIGEVRNEDLIIMKVIMKAYWYCGVP